MSPSLVKVRIPQIGEGLLEARITARLVPKGEPVTRDEPLLEIETDKATVIIEAPASGILHGWEVTEGATLPVGAVVASIRTGARSGENLPAQGTQGGGAIVAVPSVERNEGEPPHRNDQLAHSPVAAPASIQKRNRFYSPRVRAYCREHSISDDDLFLIPAARADGRLQVSDVETWLADGAAAGNSSQDRPLSPRHKQMAQRLTRSCLQVVPATIEMEFDWDLLQRAKVLVGSEAQLPVSSLDLIAWCVTRSMEKHPRLRSALIGDDLLREYGRVHLGIAVALPEDELTVAVLQDADNLPFETFISKLHGVIEKARQGRTSGAAQLTISKMSSYGIRTAQAVVVPPSVATLVIGAPFAASYPGEDGSLQWKQEARLILTFDHRILNGVGAATFLQDVQRRIHALSEHPAPNTHHSSSPRYTS